MCNLAAYAGGEVAAPILVEMMKKQEGFGGGYSSGIATISDGKLYYAKTVGDFSALCKKLNAESLPGNIGVAHSRSKGAAGEEWAHPFMDCKETVAYMANGHPGYFEDKLARNVDGLSKGLMEKGHVYRSATSTPDDAKAYAGESKWAHKTEVACHLIEEFLNEGKSPLGAIEAMCMGLPSEIAGLMLHKGFPESFFGLRFNQPLMLGSLENSVYVATTALAFPDKQEEMNVFPIPVNSVFSASVREVDIIPFHKTMGKISDNLPWFEAGKIINEVLDSGKNPTLWNLKEATAGLWGKDAAPQKDYLVYEVLRRLYEDGRIKFETVYLEGEEDGIKAPEIRVKKVV